MTHLLQQAVEAVRSLPAGRQDELAELLLQLAGQPRPVVVLTAEEELAVRESRAAADRGEFATDEEVAALWAKYGL